MNPKKISFLFYSIDNFFTDRFLRHPNYPSGMLLYIFLMLLLSLPFFEFVLCDWIIHITTRAKSTLYSPQETHLRIEIYQSAPSLVTPWIIFIPSESLYVIRRSLHTFHNSLPNCLIPLKTIELESRPIL